MLLGLTTMSNFIMKKASISIAGEGEKKTIYFLAISPLTRPAIYLGKFMGVFLITLPMILLLYIITLWVFKELFPSAPDLSQAVLETSLVTVFLFISAGMLISVLFKTEKTAAWAGKKIVTTSALLTTAWITLPFIEFLLNLTNNNTDFLLIIEKIAWLSPFTQDLMFVYTNSAGNLYNLYILIIASFVFVILGMATFSRQDFS